jgi:hypothetical protein
MGYKLMSTDEIGKMKSTLTRTLKWTAIAALIAGAFLRSTRDCALLLQLVVAAASLVVLLQAATMRRYVWMTMFLVVACMFNPVFAVPFSNYAFGIASTGAIFLFFFSLELLKPKPTLP